MPFNGSGTFTRTQDWTNDAAAAIKIRADRHDSNDDDIAAGLSNCITKDGQTTLTADINWSGKKITNLAAGVANTDAANVGQVALKVNKAGDTMTGQLTIQPPSGTQAAIVISSTGATNSLLVLNKTPASGSADYIEGRTANVARWQMFLGDSANEAGSNAGSNFSIGRCSDGGAQLDYPLTINRANGQATFVYPLNVNNPGGSGVLNLKGGTGGALIYLDKSASGQISYIEGRTATLPRWQIHMGDSAAEAGSNAGSDFRIYRFNDAGTALDSPIIVTRSNGNVTMPNALTVQGASGLNVSGGGISCGGSGSFNGNVQVSQAVTFAGGVCIIGAATGSAVIYLRGPGWANSSADVTVDTAGTLQGNNLCWGSSGISSSAGQGWYGFSSGANHSRRSGTASQGHVNFYNNVMTAPTLVGQIVTNGSATAYNTSSDENLKTFSGTYDPQLAIDIIRADPVRNYVWNDTGEPGVGWGAQTSYAVSPDLATPPSPKDAALEVIYREREKRARAGEAVAAEEPTEDEIKAVVLPQPGEPGYLPWSMDYSRRAPYVWAALAWALDQIDDLTARVATLEAAP